jgi:cell division protein FtsN
MAKSEEREFELVVGNRQLLSIIFIVMVLFGVVFTMGYFVGRNSAPENPVVAAAPPPEANTAAGRPTPSEMPAPQQPAQTETLDPGQARITPAGTGSAVPQAAAPAVPGAEPSAAAPVEQAPPRPAPQPEPAAGGQPGPGQVFLQVAAVKRPEAELIVIVLKKKGFSALIAPVPNDILFRVLVGPLQDSAALGKAKTDLEVAGFRSIVRKY